MPCLFGCLALLTPRLVLFLVWLFTDYLGRAYHTKIWPLLGFLFMPLTTLAYAWGINSAGSISGIYLVGVVVAVMIDLGMLGGGSKAARGRPAK